MASDFAEFRSELKGEIDHALGERLAFHPLSGGSVDNDREIVEIVGVLRTGDRDVQKAGFGRGNSTKSTFSADGGVLRIDREQYPALVVKKQDKFRAMDRKDQPWFEVQLVDARSHLRLICELGDA